MNRNGADQFADALQQFLNQYATKKGQMISQSNTTMPNRMWRLTLDLSQDLNGRFSRQNIAFSGLQVERIYSTSTGADKSGSVKLALDYNNIGNEVNFKRLQANDSFFADGVQFSQAFIGWDVQPDTSIDIVFFIDIDYHSGSQKTQIVGTVGVQNTNATSFYNKPPIPSSVQRLYRSGAGTSSYVIPAGKYAFVSVQGSVTGSGNGNLTIGGTIVFEMNGVGYFASEKLYAAAGETVSILNGFTGMLISAAIEIYDL